MKQSSDIADNQFNRLRKVRHRSIKSGYNRPNKALNDMQIIVQDECGSQILNMQMSPKSNIDEQIHAMNKNGGNA